MNYIITGASSGIGKRCAERLLRQGHNCVLIARNKDVLDDICKKYSNARSFVIDLAKLESIELIFDSIREYYPLDGMIHCAGVSPLKLIEENDIYTVVNTYTINLFSFIELMRCFTKDGRYNEGASVVAMSSVVAQRGSNRQAIYSGTKAALDATIRSMAREGIYKKIRVNSIVSGSVKTEMLDKLRKNSPNLDEKINRNHPLGIIPIDEVCDMIEYLLSKNSSHITGCAIPIDSGYLL